MKTKIKILHLEDSPADAELVGRELKKGNFQFEKLVVASKTAFEKALKEFAPDIILADHTLPSFDSKEAIKIIKQKAIKIPFILVSATVSEEYAVEVMKAGADDYILKDRLHRLPQAVLNAMEKNRAEANLQTIFDNTSEGFILIDTYGIVRAFNTKSAQTIFLNREQEIKTGSNIYDFIDPSRKKNYKGILEKVFAGETMQYDYSFERINGETKWFSFIINPAYNKSGEIEGACIATTDITKRKEAEQKLYESETFTQGVLSSLSSQIAVIDACGTLLAVNKAWDDFAIANGPVELSDTSVGSNYFTVCKDAIASGENDARQTMDGILSVFKKEKKSFKLEYPCHSSEEQRWFVLNVSPFGEDDTKVVISHQNITERKIAENNLSDTSVELKKTVSELNKILDSSLDVICTMNADGEFVNVSAASQQVWGYTPEELIGSKFMNLVYDEDADMTSKTTEKMISGIQVPIFENRYVHKSGRLVPLLWSINWDEKLQLMFCIAKDVTEKKRLEKAIENERDQFFHMFLKAPSAIGKFKGANHVFEMANPLYLELTGKKDIIGKTVAEVLPELIEQGFVDRLDNVYRTGESYSGKEMLAKVDKEENGELTDFYMNFVYQAYRNGEGEIEGIFFFINDVTEQVVSKKKIEKSEKQYRQIVETAQEGIWMIDENSRTTFVNKKMSEILEYTEAELIGKEHSYYMDADGKEKAMVALERRKRGTAENIEFGFISKNGKHVLTKVSANPIFDDLGNFKGSLGMISDITEKKHLEDLLEKSNRLAAIGSWEIDVVKGTVFWSDITKEIREVDKDYVPILGEGISYFKEGIHRDTISQKVQECIENGTSWDEELQIITFKGNPKWVRTIGEGEFSNGKCIRIQGSFQDITERKNAGIKITESEFRYRQIVETAQEGIWMLDENSETTFVNQKMCEIIGYSVDEMMGKSNLFFKDEADLQTAIDSHKRRRQGISETYDASFITKDGRLIWTQISSNPIFDDTKKYKGALGMVSDITEKVMAEKMLLESEQKYRKLASELEIERLRLITAQAIAKLGNWEADLQTMRVNWSEEMHHIYGTDSNNFKPSYLPIQSFVHSEDRQRIDKAFKDSLQKSGAICVEHRIITLKGIEKWVEENWTVTRDEKGTPMIAIGTCQDITATKKAEEALRLSQSNLQAIIENTDATIYSLNTELMYIAFNKSLYDLVKQTYGIELKIGDNTLSFLEKLEPEEAERWTEIYAKALKGETVKFEKEFTVGDVYNCSSFTIYPIRANKTIIGLSCFVYDITKQKEEQKQKEKMITDIVQRNSNLEQFSYIVSHNLRAPTANIIGFTEILKDETLTPQEQKVSLQGLSTSVAALDTVIKDINHILQVKSEINEEKEVITFSKLVDDIIISIENLINKHHVRIKTDFSEVDEIYSLKIYVYSIFYNLITNSIKYGKPDESPLIEIKSKKENGKIILIFKDYGLGIDLTKQGDKIFGLYKRFHSHVEGKGMGLYMVKTQVESLGGKITVASEPNKGTEFTILFEI